MLSSCYNVVGKSGWGCTGSRRKCGTGLCCGKQFILNKAVDYTCEDETVTTIGNYSFQCNPDRTASAIKLIGATGALLGASFMLA